MSTGSTDSSGSGDRRSPDPTTRVPAARKTIALRIDPAVYEALARWAADDLRSVNAQIEVLLPRCLHDAGRAPREVAPIPRRGRPRREL